MSKPPSPVVSTDASIPCPALPLACTVPSTTPHLAYSRDGDSRHAVLEGTSSHQAPPAQNPTPVITRTKV